MANKLVIHCEALGCKHNSGGFLFGTCQNPELTNSVPFNGIVRMYHETCPKKELDPDRKTYRIAKVRTDHGI